MSFLVQPHGFSNRWPCSGHAAWPPLNQLMAMALTLPVVGSVQGSLGPSVITRAGVAHDHGTYPECSSVAYRSAIAYLVRQWPVSNSYYRGMCPVRPGAGQPYQGLMRLANAIVKQSLATYYYYESTDDVPFPHDRYLPVGRPPYGLNLLYHVTTIRWVSQRIQISWAMPKLPSYLVAGVMYYLLVPAITAVSMGPPEQYCHYWMGLTTRSWPPESSPTRRSFYDTRCPWAYRPLERACVLHFSMHTDNRFARRVVTTCGHAGCPPP